MTDDLQVLSDAEVAARAAFRESPTEQKEENLYVAIGKHIDAVMDAYRAGDLVPAAAIEAARAEEREVWALAAQDIADSNHSYEAAKQFSRFARALRAGGEHD